MHSADGTDDRTMTFLMDRSTIVVSAAKGKHGRNYLSSLDITHFGHGTGVFVERNDRGYVVTNEHVIRAWVRAPQGVPVSVAVALGRGCAAAEDHTHFVPSARVFANDGHGNAKPGADHRPIPADTTTGFDLGLIVMSDASFKRAKVEGKHFVAWSPPVEPLVVGDRVCFRGYCAGDVDVINAEPPQIVGDGYTLFSEVTAIQGTQISVDATEAKVCYGKGATNPKRDLHGISGSGLFDMSGILRAIVWGGLPDHSVIYACPVDGLTSLFSKLDDVL